jgi:hypothetical protein
VMRPVASMSVVTATDDDDDDTRANKRLQLHVSSSQHDDHTDILE